MLLSGALTPAPAQAPETVPATEAALVRMALERNLELAAARARLAESRGRLLLAGARPNPEIEFSFTDGGVFGTPGEREVSAGYAHVLELGGKRVRRIEVARAAEELAQFEILDRERLLRAEVRLGYTAALAARRNLETAAELVGLNEESLVLVRMRVDAGESAPLESGLLQVELNRLRTDHLMFQTALGRALGDLRVLIGAPPDAGLQVEGALRTEAADVPVEELVRSALARRPDLEAARIRERLVAAEAELAAAEGTPDAVVFGRFTRSHARFDAFGLSGEGTPVPLRDTDNTWTAGITFDLPVANRSQGQMQAALARRRAAAFEREHLEQVVRSQVRTAYDRLQAAEQVVALFDAQILGQAETNLEAVRTAYQFGELRLLDVVAEQRRLIEARQAYTAALAEQRAAFVELERAVGGAWGEAAPVLEVTDVRN